MASILSRPQWVKPSFFITSSISKAFTFTSCAFSISSCFFFRSHAAAFLPVFQGPKSKSDESSLLSFCDFRDPKSSSICSFNFLDNLWVGILLFLLFRGVLLISNGSFVFFSTFSLSVVPSSATVVALPGVHWKSWVFAGVGRRFRGVLV